MNINNFRYRPSFRCHIHPKPVPRRKFTFTEIAEVGILAFLAGAGFIWGLIRFLKKFI